MFMILEPIISYFLAKHTFESLLTYMMLHVEIVNLCMKYRLQLS